MLALAPLPTTTVPSLRKATTLAETGSPKALGRTSTLRPRESATHEVLVPRSMPTAISAMLPSAGGRGEAPARGAAPGARPAPLVSAGTGRS